MSHHGHQSLLEVFQHLVSTRPKEKVLMVPNGTEYEEINYQDLDIIINKYANYWNKQLENENLEKDSVISFFSLSGPEYLYNMMALWKLGFTVLFLSPRNSEPALIHLLQESKSHILIYDSQLSKISESVQSELGSQHSQTLKIFQIPNNLKNENIDHLVPVLKQDDDPYEKIIAIFHSSGSTSFPKLVPLTNRYFLFVKQSDKVDDIVLTTGPLFHIFGMTVLASTIFYPGTVYVFPIVSGSIPLVNEILYSLDQSKSNVLYTLPATIEQIYKNNPEEIKALLKLSSLYYAGAALSPQIGEKLVQSGVNLKSVYASTETGILMETSKNSSSPNIPWNAMKLTIPESSIRWIERNDFLDGAKELVVKKGTPTLSNIKGNTENDDYRVGDLFIETPKGSGFYIILGRADDTIVHSTGEKTNPLPIEDTIRLNQFVKQVVVVGFNRPFNCLLIELDYENIKITPFLNVTKSIFDSIHQANNDCPSHSRIFDEMVYILPLEGKTLSRTLKNNVQRKKVEIEFKEEIEMLYDNFVNAKIVTNNKFFSNNQWNEDSVKSIILDSLKSAIGDSFSLTDDGETSFFFIGLDSLSATKLRAILQKQFPIINLPHDVIFEYNTFQSLTQYLTKELLKISSSQCQNAEDEFKAKLQALKNEVDSYIQKYSTTDKFPPVANFNKINEVINEECGETVLMTGVTGSLGSFILRDLLNNQNVLKVYCLVRASDENHGWSRLKDSFEQRNLDTSLLSKERVIILPSDLSDSKFGQTENIYSNLVQEVTQIYHVAWRLDFNSKIEVFERDSIAGTVHLLMLAREAYTHHKNVHFNFTSSISTTIGSKTNVKEDELPHDISNAMLNGYGLSKFITENVCAEWSRKIGFKLDIHRVGQVSGDSVTGVWNTREHIPLMIKGAQIMKIMPDSYSSNVDWIPVDVASQSIVDISLSSPFGNDSDYVRVNHILNPKQVTWNEFLKSLQQSGIDFKIVSNKEWLNTLLNTPEYQNVDKNPIAALSGFFEKAMSESSDKSEKYEPLFETQKSSGRSLALFNCQKIDVKLVSLYINNWKRISFLDS
ncbi:acetyl-CoA synthetase-like protein [Gigaspora margarita]|uniref:Acetyl-CoA synthetase-like protein n=1 Tax=Gigaspora margarita TaxID=4874 RepID=A0A8H3X4Y9_GIGMA|nr:acetyl-CoA synthetase-like protein [Gigaspora margarita]